MVVSGGGVGRVAYWYVEWVRGREGVDPEDLPIACACEPKVDWGDVHVDLQDVCGHAPEGPSDYFACKPLDLTNFSGMLY